jgi:DNA-directed RNA polymerase subunit beta'
LILDLSMQALEKVVYFASFIVTDVNEDLKNATLEQIKNEFKQKKKSIENDFSKQSVEIKNRKAKLLQENENRVEVDEMIESELSP